MDRLFDGLYEAAGRLWVEEEVVVVRCFLLRDCFDDFLSNGTANDGSGRRDLSEGVFEVRIGDCCSGRDLVTDGVQLFDVFIATCRQRIAFFSFTELLEHFHDEVSRAGLLDRLEEHS